MPRLSTPAALSNRRRKRPIGILLRLAELKKQGRLRALVAAGCLPQRFQEEFLKELPEVDAAVGTGSVEDIAQAVRAALDGDRRAWFGANETAEQGGGRDLLTPAYSAYLRIAEGCDNRCAYCVIPYIRGPYRSRPMEELVQEARGLAQNGCKRASGRGAGYLTLWHGLIRQTMSAYIIAGALPD